MALGATTSDQWHVLGQQGAVLEMLRTPIQMLRPQVLATATHAWIARATARTGDTPARAGLAFDPQVWRKVASGKLSTVVSR
eukprot:4245165-Alexandrium_andersonii.AAC.1